MRGQIEQLKAGIERSRALIARVKNAGIEVSDEELALREAATKLTLARTEMHAFDAAAVAPIIADGMTIVADVDAAGQQGVGRAALPPARPRALARRHPALRRRAGTEGPADRRRSHP